MFIARYCDKLTGVEMMCDGCRAMLPGAHYHCLECEAFDFCYTCFSGEFQDNGFLTSDLSNHMSVHFWFVEPVVLSLLTP